jgi:hypothetical protein
MNQNLKVENTQNCFTASLKAVLNFYNFNGDIIMNRHIGFFYNRKDFLNFEISCYNEISLLKSIYTIEKIKIEIKNILCANTAEEKLISDLSTNNPIILFLDTFFLPFFKKRNGHKVHIAIVYDLDITKKLVKIASSLPYSGEIFLNSLKIARNSKINNFLIKNSYLEITKPNFLREIDKEYIYEILNNNINIMKNENDYSGIVGLQNFKKDFFEWHKVLSEEILKNILKSCFEQLLYLTEQRKAYVSFLEYININILEINDILNTYKKIAFDWEIFRNLCFKSYQVDRNLKQNLLNKLDTIITNEEKGIKLLEDMIQRI